MLLEVESKAQNTGSQRGIFAKKQLLLPQPTGGCVCLVYHSPEMLGAVARCKISNIA